MDFSPQHKKQGGVKHFWLLWVNISHHRDEPNSSPHFVLSWCLASFLTHRNGLGAQHLFSDYLPFKEPTPKSGDVSSMPNSGKYAPEQP